MAKLSRTRRDFLVSNRDELQCGSGWQNQRSLPYHSPRPACPDGDICKDCEYVLHLMVWPLDECEKRDDEVNGCVGWVDRCVFTIHAVRFATLARSLAAKHAGLRILSILPLVRQDLLRWLSWISAS